MDIEHVRYHAGEEDVDRTKADDHEQGRGDIRVADGAHSDDAEVLTIEGIDGDTRSEVDEEEDEGLMEGRPGGCRDGRGRCH